MSSFTKHLTKKSFFAILCYTPDCSQYLRFLGIPENVIIQPAHTHLFFESFSRVFSEEKDYKFV